MRKAVDILGRTAEGREALYEVIDQYGGLTSLHSNDPLEQARLVARRGVATDILKHLLTDERNTLTVMFNERFERLENQRAKRNDDDNGN